LPGPNVQELTPSLQKTTSHKIYFLVIEDIEIDGYLIRGFGLHEDDDLHLLIEGNKLQRCAIQVQKLNISDPNSTRTVAHGGNAAVKLLRSLERSPSDLGVCR